MTSSLHKLNKSALPLRLRTEMLPFSNDEGHRKLSFFLCGCKRDAAPLPGRPLRRPGRTCTAFRASHLLDFGPAGIGLQTQRNKEGTGVQVHPQPNRGGGVGKAEWVPQMPEVGFSGPVFSFIYPASPKGNSVMACCPPCPQATPPPCMNATFSGVQKDRWREIGGFCD